MPKETQLELFREFLTDEKKSKFTHKLAHLINCESLESLSDTPDFIIAEFLTDCLTALSRAINVREKWYGREPTSVDPPPQEEPPIF